VSKNPTSQAAAGRPADRADDMLYSTLLASLESAGATDVTLGASTGGRRVEIDLKAAAPARSMP